MGEAGTIEYPEGDVVFTTDAKLDPNGPYHTYIFMGLGGARKL